MYVISLQNSDLRWMFYVVRYIITLTCFYVNFRKSAFLTVNFDNANTLQSNLNMNTQYDAMYNYLDQMFINEDLVMKGNVNKHYRDQTEHEYFK